MLPSLQLEDVEVRLFGFGAQSLKTMGQAFRFMIRRLGFVNRISGLGFDV